MKKCLFLGLIFLLLVGCVDYKEELWLNRDGSGKAKVIIGVLTSYLNEQVINRYTTQKGIHLISKDVYRKGKYTYYKLEFRFDSLTAFNNLNDQISNTDFIGKITLQKDHNGNLLLKRRIALGGIEGEDELEQLIFTQSMENLKWHYKLHLPWKIIKANTTPANVNYAEKTVEWTYQTAKLWNKSQTMMVLMKPHFPWLLLIEIVGGVLLVIIIFSFIRRHLKRKES